MKKTNSRSDIYPELKYFIENNSSMKSEWLKEFINISPEGTLSLEEINLIARSFGYFSSIQIHSNSDNRRNRIPSYFQIEEFSNVKIVNFSDSGVCIKYSKDFKLDKKTEVSCLIGPYKKAKLIVEKVWESNDGLMGLRVLEFNSEWEKLLIETYRNKKLNKGRESA